MIISINKRMLALEKLVSGKTELTSPEVRALAISKV